MLPDPYVLAFLLVLSIIFLLGYARMTVAVRGSAACVRGLHGTLEMLGNKYVFDSVRLAFVLLLPFYALSLVATGLSARSYFFTLLVLAAFFLFRKMICSLVGWLTARRAAFRQLEWTGCAFFLMAMVLSLPAALLVWLVPATPHGLLWAWIGLEFCAAVGFYARRGFSLIFPTGFSVFFWVLYLCILEILPISVVANILINGN